MYQLDCIPTPMKDDDRHAEDHLAMIAELPESFTLIDMLSPIRDQGPKGSCVAHAVCCMKEYQEVKDIGFNKVYFSPEFIYNRRPNRPQSGMYIRDALQIISDHGILPEKNYPYPYDYQAPQVLGQAPQVPEGLEPEMTEKLRKKAINYRIKAFARVNTINELKHALMESGPCPIAFPVYRIHGTIWTPPSSSSSSSSNEDGSSGDKQMLGYHAMVVVGWNPAGFVVRNSWGISWGCAGYTMYSYQDWGSHCEAWTSYDDKSQPDPSDTSRKNSNTPARPQQCFPLRLWSS